MLLGLCENGDFFLSLLLPLSGKVQTAPGSAQLNSCPSPRVINPSVLRVEGDTLCSGLGWIGL